MGGDFLAIDYTMPEFLSGNSVDEIHRRMLDVLPSDIEKTENSIPWDFTRPPAIEKAEFVEFHLNETIKLCFPQFSYGKWLDYHGELRNVPRKEANCASGYLEVRGIVGTELPSGFQFATTANGSSVSASVVFALVEGLRIGETGVELALVEAVSGGISGNVAVDTVKLMVNPVTGVTYVSNLEPISGGTEIEEDESYRERILESIAMGSSYTGCNSDYLRWAKELSGVGYVIVDPEWDDPDLPDSFHYKDASGVRRCAGTVRLIVVDENGSPANEQILSELLLHISGEDERDIARLAPIGAKVTVVAPSTYAIDLSATLVLEEGADFHSVQAEILENLQEYWLSVALEAQSSVSGVAWLYYAQVGAVLAKTSGVLTYEDLLVNGGTEGILLTQAEFPCTGEVTFLGAG